LHWIDTHTHLYLDNFKADIDAVLERSFKNGVTKLCLPAIEKATHSSLIKLAAKNPDAIFTMLGLHPCSVKENYKDELAFVEAQINATQNFVAIGEIGIDLYWDKTFIAEQIEAFKIQIEWAKELGKPIVIHARNSFNEIFEVLDEVKDDRLYGVFHCFTGGKRHAKKAIELGFKLGIGGVLTFDQGLPNVIKRIDMEHLVLETDSPFLAPIPFKGKQNESSYIPYIGEKLAEIKNLPVEEVARITTENAQRLFGI
jgi:TatD DNase family protein